MPPFDTFLLARYIFNMIMKIIINKKIMNRIKPNRRSKITLLISQLLIIAAGYTAAQSQSATLKGIVTDEAGAIIPGATLVLRIETEKIRETMSSDGGEFSFDELPFGKYKLTVVKAGFADVERTIMLDDTSNDAAMTMAAGAVAESVTVIMDSAEAAVNSTLKSGETIHETPRSITTIGETRIREQNFRQVSDVLNYVPGTTQNSYRNGSYHFYSRGYRMGPDDTRLDGFAGVNVGSGGFGGTMFGVEEAVVLRGPASILYGQTGSPGGLINLVSKRPQPDRFTRFDLRTGGYSGNGVSLGKRPMAGVDFDATGAIDRDSRIQYRGLASWEDMNYFTANTRDKNRYANASFLFKLDRDGLFVLTPNAQYTQYFRPYGGGIVASPSSSLSASLTPATDPVGTPISTADLSPLDINLFGGRRIEKTGWYGLDFRGVPTEKIRVNAAYRNISFDTDINSFTPQVSTASQINQLRTAFTVARIQAKSETERRYDNFNADASYEWLSNATIRNTTQIGFYSRILDSRTTTPLGALPTAQSPINIYTGVAATPLVDNYPSLTFGAFTRDTIWNGFVQNRTSLAGGRVNVALGFSYGQQKPAVGATRKSGFIPNAAIVFNATPQLAIYGSYSTSYNPIDPNLENATGQIGTFDPTIGKNYEVGAKYDLLNRRLGLNFALFQNQVDNALVQSDIGVLNPNNTRYYIPSGTRRARGAEFSGQFQIRHDLNVSAGVSYTSALYLGVPSGVTVSSSPIPNSWAEKTPRFSYNVYTRYDRREGFLKGFGAGLGVIWQGKRIGSNGARTFASPDPLVLPAFTRVDSALFYRVNRFLNFGLNVENVFDQLIFVNASVGSAIEIAAPRTATLRTTLTF